MNVTVFCDGVRREEHIALHESMLSVAIRLRQLFKVSHGCEVWLMDQGRWRPLKLMFPAPVQGVHDGSALMLCWPEPTVVWTRR